MSSVSGPGGGGNVGGIRPGGVDTSEAAKEEEAANAVKDINKKTDTIKQTVKVESDAFSVARSNHFTFERTNAAESRQELLAQTLPEAVQIVENAFGAEVDASKLLKLQPKLSTDPQVKEAVRELRIQVEEWSKATLVALENQPLTIELPRIELPQPQSSSNTGNPSQQQQQQGTGTPSPAPQSTTPQAPGTPQLPPGTPQLPQGTTPQAQGAPMPPQSTPTPESPPQMPPGTPLPPTPPGAEGTQAHVAEGTQTQPKPTEGAQTLVAQEGAQALKVASHDPPLTPFEQQAQKIADAMFTLPANPENVETLSKEQKFLLTIMDPPQPSAVPGEEPRFDKYGNMIVEERYNARVAMAFQNLGPSPQLLAAYNTSLFLLSEPVSLDEEGAGEGALGLEAEDGGADGGFIPPQPPGAPVTPIQEGTQRQEGEGGGGGVNNTGGVTRGSQGLSALDFMNDGSGDITMYAMLVLMDTLKDLNKDIKQKMMWAKVNHAMNDAMRKHMADVMKQIAMLPKQSDPEKMPEGIFIENLSPVAVIGPDGNPTGEVEMVPITVETPYTTVTADDQPGITPKPILAETQAADIVGKMERSGIEYTRRPPGSGTENGTVFISSTSSYVTSEHTVIIKERLKNQIQQLKMDLEKEMLGVQKITGMRKNVMDNLNKMIKSKSEEWGKQIALMRR